MLRTPSERAAKPTAVSCGLPLYRLLRLKQDQCRWRLTRCRFELVTLMQDQTLKAEDRIRQGNGRLSDLPQPGVELATRVHAHNS